MTFNAPVRRLVLPIALLGALTACAGAGPVEIRRNVDVTRPPESAPLVVLSESTYTEIMGKGYARIGSISASQIDGSESALAETVKTEASRLGAAAVRLSSSSETKTGFSGGSHPVTTVDGKGNYQSTWSPAHGHETTYTDVSVYAELFARDSALAAKQLMEGPKRWAKKVAAIREKRATMLAMLSTLQDKLRQFDASQVTGQTPSGDPAADEVIRGRIIHADMVLRERRARDRALGLKSLPVLAADDRAVVVFPVLSRWLQIAKDSIESIEVWTDDHFVSMSPCDLVEGTLGYPFFKDPKSPQVQEYQGLAHSAIHYLRDNITFIADRSTENQKEHLIFTE